MRAIPNCLVMACLVAGTVNGASPEACSIQADFTRKCTSQSSVTEVEHFSLVVHELKKLLADGNLRANSYLAHVFRLGRGALDAGSVSLHGTFDFFREAHDAGFPLDTCAFLCSSSDATDVEREI